MKIPIFEHATVYPLKALGLTNPFWNIHIETIIFTWISMAMIFFIVFTGRYYFKRNKVNPYSYAIEQVIEFFVNLCKDSFGFFEYRYFSFIMALFVFTMFCSFSGMLPFVKEPTEDLNTALACGVSAFLYVQYQKIRVVGIAGYLKDYFKPIFILFPLNIVGELAKAASMSFRLFGNILGGSIIIVIALKSVESHRINFMIYTAVALPAIWLLPKLFDLSKHKYVQQIINFNNLVIFSGAWLLMFFGLFEGVVQAFVITMLTVTYLSLIGQKKSKKAKECSTC